jgi:hypothetical protein
MVFCYYKFGLTQSTEAARDKSLATAARQIYELEKAWGADLGGADSKKRFDELFAEAPKLKTAYQALRKGK